VGTADGSTAVPATLGKPAAGDGLDLLQRMPSVVAISYRCPIRSTIGERHDS